MVRLAGYDGETLRHATSQILMERDPLLAATLVRWTGLEVRALRDAARMSMRAFAAETGLSVARLAEMEAQGERARLRQATQQILDRLLDDASPAVRARFEALLADLRENAPSKRTVGSGETAAALIPWPGGRHARFDPRILRGGSVGSVLTLAAPSGRVFTGAGISARLCPAVDNGRILVTVPADEPGAWMGWPGRELVVGVVERGEEVDAFAVDARSASQRMTGRGGMLSIPWAYRLDDLTTGLLWAVANLDSALLGDDARLATCQQWVSGYEMLSSSAASRDAVEGLSPVSQMWLGSDFCARHILRHCGSLSEVPAFWTREQHGEVASTWLLFTHKHDYLRQLADRYRNGSSPATRTFSITEPAIADSPRPERVLLMLAVALMESFGIEINICLDEEYRELEGFMLDRGRSAIVANWVDSDAVWHVDVNSDRPALRAYADALDLGRAQSATAAATSGGRLMALASLLDLDWAWLVHRCGELAAYGSVGIAEPRSRLLSTTGVDRACGYLAAVARDGR